MNGLCDVCKLPATIERSVSRLGDDQVVTRLYDLCAECAKDTDRELSLPHPTADWREVELSFVEELHGVRA